MGYEILFWVKSKIDQGSDRRPGPYLIVRTQVRSLRRVENQTYPCVLCKIFQSQFNLVVDDESLLFRVCTDICPYQLLKQSTNKHFP